MAIITYKTNGNITLEALKSRILLIVLQYVANIMIPDHKPEVFHFTKTSHNYGIFDKIIFHFFGGFLRWDAQYFVHISVHGYTYENTVAFFPLLAVFVGTISKIIHLFFNFISIEAIVLLLYIIFNVFVFLIATITLYKLTYLVFNDTKVAYKTTFLFCYNPASIFFIAPYTECLYSLLSFQVMLSCMQMYGIRENENLNFLKIFINNFLLIVVTGLSTIVRSNGVLNIGFIIFTFICLMKRHFSSKAPYSVLNAIKYLGLIIIFSLISIVPFCIYQLYCYRRFCTDFSLNLSKDVIDYAVHQRYLLPGQFRIYNQTWCYNQIPLAYSYVQNHYWNVGFLKYYDPKQIPNFILAAPVILIILKNSIVHFKMNLRKNPFNIFMFPKTFDTNKHVKISITNPGINVFVVHAFVLVIFCIFFIHIQVTTRMVCSASPILYWYCNQYLSDSTKEGSNRLLYFCYKSTTELVIKIYFYSYFIIGTVLFTNFLPWT